MDWSWVSQNWGSVDHRPVNNWGRVSNHWPVDNWSDHWGMVNGNWGMMDHWVDRSVDKSWSNNGSSMDQGVVGPMGLLDAVGDNGSMSNDALVAGLVSSGSGQEGREGKKGLKQERIRFIFNPITFLVKLQWMERERQQQKS